MTDADGGQSGTRSEQIHDWEPVSAAHYTGDHECQYDCEETADYAVEWKTSGYTGGRVTLICESCDRQNVVHAERNDLILREISDKGMDAMPEEVRADVE